MSLPSEVIAMIVLGTLIFSVPVVYDNKTLQYVNKSNTVIA